MGLRFPHQSTVVTNMVVVVIFQAPLECQDLLDGWNSAVLIQLTPHEVFWNEGLNQGQI